MCAPGKPEGPSLGCLLDHVVGGKQSLGRRPLPLGVSQQRSRRWQSPCPAAGSRGGLLHLLVPVGLKALTLTSFAFWTRIHRSFIHSFILAHLSKFLFHLALPRESYQITKFGFARAPAHLLSQAGQSHYMLSVQQLPQARCNTIVLMSPLLSLICAVPSVITVLTNCPKYSFRHVPSTNNSCNSIKKSHVTWKLTQQFFDHFKILRLWTRPMNLKYVPPQYRPWPQQR